MIFCILNNKDIVFRYMMHDKKWSGMQKSNYSHTGDGLAWEMTRSFQGKDRYVILYPRGKDCHISGGQTVIWHLSGEKVWHFPGGKTVMWHLYGGKMSCDILSRRKNCHVTDILSGGKAVTSVRGKCHMTFYPWENVSHDISSRGGLTWEELSCATGVI